MHSMQRYEYEYRHRRSLNIVTIQTSTKHRKHRLDGYMDELNVVVVMDS